MEKDEFFLKRIRELANLSWQRDIVTFSDFLNLNEQNIVSSLKHQFPQIVMETSGGYENAERQMVAFHPDALAFTWEYPIDCLRIEPKALKFSEELSHRDYLGALLNLGVDRSVIGDIIVQKKARSEERRVGKECRSSMVSYIEGGQVFVNGKLITSNGYEPKDGDIISVRGKGRFIFDGVSHQTKKGRCSVRIMRYV
mgnify:CR=1 FL=1